MSKQKSETPRTDAQMFASWHRDEAVAFAKQLERELNQCRADLKMCAEALRLHDCPNSIHKLMGRPKVKCEICEALNNPRIQQLLNEK